MRPSSTPWVHDEGSVHHEAFRFDAREAVPDEPWDIQFGFLREDLLHPGMGRGTGRSEEVANFGSPRHLVGPDLPGAVHDLLLVEADQGAKDRSAGDRVDRPEARESLARDLPEVLACEEDVRALAVSDLVRETDHQAFRQDEVEPAVRQMSDLGEGLPDPHDVQGREAQNPAEGPGLD